jgi:cell division protein FtsB
MRNEEHLHASYEKQKQLFETAKTRKIQNLQERQKQIKQKMEKLNSELRNTEELLEKEREREFCSFRIFQERASTQSAQKRDKISS